MTLKAKLDTLEGLPEAVAGEYKEAEEGGYFVLDVEPIGGFALENVAGLKETLADRKMKASSRKEALAAFEGIDPAKAKEALSKYEEIKNWTPDEKAREIIAAREADLTGKHTGIVEGLTGERDRYRTQLEASLIDGAVTTEIVKLKGNPTLLAPHVTKNVKLFEKDGKFVAKVVGDNGEPRVTMKANSTDDMGIAEYLEILKKKDEFMPAFAGSGASGGGAGGSGSAGRGAKGEIVLSFEDAKDMDKWKAAQARAKELKVDLLVEDHPSWGNHN